MASFDIVSNVDMQEVDNAVNNVIKEIDQRYDFKGSNCEVTRSDDEVTVVADDTYKLEQIQSMLKTHFTRRKIDAKSLEFGKEEMASGNSIRQKIKVKQGIDSETAKKVVKKIKDTKLKVQASVRGEEVRVDGKKIDDLQNIIAMLKDFDIQLPLQYINFRS